MTLPLSLAVILLVFLMGRVPAGCGEFHRSPREPSEGCLATGRQASPRVFSPSFTPPCPFLGTSIPLLCTPIFLANRLLHLRLRPRRHAKQQHLTQRPDPIRQARRHRRRARPPHLGRTRTVGRDRLWQWLA